MAISIIGSESLNRRQQQNDQSQSPEIMSPNATTTTTTTSPPDAIQSFVDSRMNRPSRRPASHFNHFQTTCTTSTDSPPPYAVATRHAYKQTESAKDRLPGYTCTVQAEGKFLLSLESINPLHGTSESDWKEVYMILRGTLLSFYRLKDNGPGRVLRSYTLQHAEVGLATDSQHNVLIPQTRFAHLVPAAARKRAWQKDPDLFRVEKQTLLRLRAETDQLLLADASEERIHDLIHSLSAAIDISHAIDERSIPKFCTVPRRRRRRGGHHTSTDLSDPSLLAEQERMMREMYPSLATPSSTPSTPIREEDEFDLSTMREDAPVSTRPPLSRQTTASSISSIHASDPANFNATSGKWEPLHTRSAEQIQRYIRRCMPVLHAESVRASDIIIHNGVRVKINWRMQVLEEWELKPPSYRSHHFEQTSIIRRTSQSSSTSARPTSVQYHGIEEVEASMGQLFPLTKTTTNTSDDKVESRPTTKNTTSNNDLPGVVFCF